MKFNGGVVFDFGIGLGNRDVVDGDEAIFDETLQSRTIIARVFFD